MSESLPTAQIFVVAFFFLSSRLGVGEPREGASAFIMNQPTTKEEKDGVLQTERSHNQDKAEEFDSGVTRTKKSNI